MLSIKVAVNNYWS